MRFTSRLKGAALARLIAALRRQVASREAAASRSTVR